MRNTTHSVDERVILKRRALGYAAAMLPAPTLKRVHTPSKQHANTPETPCSAAGNHRPQAAAPKTP